MRITFVWVGIISLFSACNPKEKIPDVSAIKIDLSTERFERDFFKVDSVNFTQQFEQLMGKYPSFGENFLSTILNSDPKWSADTVRNYVWGFIKAYRNVFDSSEIIYKDFSPYEKEIRKGLQFLHYYFPGYIAPKKIITYIGPLDGFGDILADDAFIIGLHHHLGKNFPLYQSEMVQQIYPSYISSLFTPEQIATNCMKNVILDMYPEKMDDKTLIHQMIEKGKRLFLLQKLLPYSDEYKIMGYSEAQMKSCYKNEVAIWDLFIKNNILQTIDNNLIKNYIGESPKTQELVDADGKFAPGNIGSFAGWQIVKKYMAKNPAVSPEQLMKLDNEVVFSEARYKP